MNFRDLFLTQHARAHTAEVGHPDLSIQDIIPQNLRGEHLRARHILRVFLSWKRLYY